MKVLSLFDGISGAAQALKELGVDCEYYASEVDKYAIQVSKANHPNIIQIGDVNNVKFEDFVGFDLLVAGFPCQDLSVAKRDGKGLEGARSGLFSKCLEALEICKPKYFLFENVNSMKKEWKDKISELLGVEPIMINSALLTAQMRKRLYWTNIPNIQQPEDKGTVLKDIIESVDTERLKSYCITATYSRACPEDYFNHGQRQLIFKANNGKRVEVDLLKDFYAFREVRTEEGKRKRAEFRKLTGLDSTKRGPGDKKFIPKNDGKANCLTTGLGIEGVIKIKEMVRKLTPIECERLQGFPDNYSESVSNSQRYKALGNSFTVPVIKHILSFIKQTNSKSTN